MPLHRLDSRQTRQLATVAPKHSTMRAMGAGIVTSAPINTMLSIPPIMAALNNAPNRRVITSITAIEEQMQELLVELTTHLWVSLRAVGRPTIHGPTHTRRALPQMQLATLVTAITSQVTQRLPITLRKGVPHYPLQVPQLSQATAVVEEMQTLLATTF